MVIAAVVSSAIAAAIVTTVVGVGVKLADRELHLTEDRAGIVVIAGLGILLGQAEVAGGKHKLNLALHANHRENADGNVNVVCADAIYEAAVEAVADRLGNRVDAHTAMTELPASFDKLTVETDGLCDLDDNRRKSGFSVTAKVAFVEAEAVVFGVGAEYRHVLFTTVKNNFLVKRRKSLDLCYSASAGASLESHAEVIADSDLIKALVEGYGLDIDVSVDDLNAFTSDGGCTIDDLLRRIAEMDPHVLKAVLIACRVENLIYTYTTEGFLVVTAKTAEGIVSFHHLNSSLSD